MKTSWVWRTSWVWKMDWKTWSIHRVCTCSCLCSNTHRIVTVDVLHVGLKLHWKHDTSINFHCLQARLLWRWRSFGNCVLPLSNRRAFFQMEKGNGEDAKGSGKTSKSLYSQKCSLHDRGGTPIIAPQHRPWNNMGGREGDSSQAQTVLPQVRPSQPGGNSLHTSLWSLC